MKYIKYVITLFMLSNSANAAVITSDWKSVSDQLITRDTVSGLDWLNLTETNNMSYTAVNSQLSSGGIFEGWRYATNDEVVFLWNNFSIDLSPRPEFSVDGLDPGLIEASSFLGNIMNEYASGYIAGLLGYTSDSISNNRHTRLGAYALGANLAGNTVPVTTYNHMGD